MSQNASAEEMAAMGLCDLPDPRLLDQATTQGQKDYWEQIRAFYSIVSLCWRSKFLPSSKGPKSLNDPIASLVDSKAMDPLYYEVAWGRTEKLQTLYKILERNEACIARTAIELGFNYPYTLSSLFASIVSTDANKLFKTCLNPYKNIQTKNIVTASKLLLKLSDFEKLKHQETRDIKRLSSQLEQNNLYDFAIQISAYRAAHDKQIEELLYQYIAAIGREAAATKTASSRKRDSKTFSKCRSFVWSNGKIVYGDRYGGTYDINKTS